MELLNKFRNRDMKDVINYEDKNKTYKVDFFFSF
jgi:hypothetical protein